MKAESRQPGSPILTKATVLVRYGIQRVLEWTMLPRNLSDAIPLVLWSFGKHSKLQAQSFMHAP